MNANFALPWVIPADSSETARVGAVKTLKILCHEFSLFVFYVFLKHRMSTFTEVVKCDSEHSKESKSHKDGRYA